MSVHELDPLQDHRWVELLDRHPKASAFHTPGWLEALRRTYGYQPVVLTTTPVGQPLKNGLVLCRVKSWLTGSRMVSLPFTDHCEPLVENGDELRAMLCWLGRLPSVAGWKYIELRPLTTFCQDIGKQGGFAESAGFTFHKIDLRPELRALYRSLHKSSCVQMVQRAEREGLVIEAGNPASLLDEFYSLLLLTRRRHQVPPQPLCWFQNLIRAFGERLVIRVARKDKEAIAGILTISYKKVVIYKYGCSNAKHHNLGGIPLLLWDAIQAGKQEGAEEFDMGRSELDNPGLITFKERWAGIRSDLKYYRYPERPRNQSAPDWRLTFAGRLLAALPDSCFTATGRLLYKHVG